MHAYKPVNWIYPNRRKPSKYTLCGYTKISTSSVSISTKRCKSNAVSTLGVQQRVAKVMQYEIVVHCYNTSLFFSSCNRGFFTKCYSTIQLPASCSESQILTRFGCAASECLQAKLHQSQTNGGIKTITFIHLRVVKNILQKLIYVTLQKNPIAL